MISQQLVEENLNIAQIITRKYSFGCPSKRDDIYQEAVAGMCYATINFDPDKGEFRARAYIYAERAVQKYLQNQTFFKYTSNNYLKNFWKSTDIKLAYERGDEAVEEFCEKQKISKKSLDRVMCFLNAKPISFHKLEDNDSEDAKLFFSAIYDHTDEELDKKTLKREIARALKALTPRQALILKELYFGDEPKTMQAVADKLGVSRQRVDQIQKQSLAILKSKLLASPTFCALR